MFNRKLLLPISLFVGAFIGAPAWAQTVYRCGESYSTVPCPQGQAIQVADPRDSAQKQQAEQAAARDAAVAQRMAQDRQAQERAAARAPLPAGSSVLGAAATNPPATVTNADGVIEPKPASAFASPGKAFVAQVPASAVPAAPVADGTAQSPRTAKLKSGQTSAGTGKRKAIKALPLHAAAPQAHGKKARKAKNAQVGTGTKTSKKAAKRKTKRGKVTSAPTSKARRAAPVAGTTGAGGQASLLPPLGTTR